MAPDDAIPLKRTVNLVDDVLVRDATTNPVNPVEMFRSAVVTPALNVYRDVDVRISMDGATAPREIREVVVMIGVGEGG